jgi:hypothetical protein
MNENAMCEMAGTGCCKFWGNTWRLHTLFRGWRIK